MRIVFAGTPEFAVPSLRVAVRHGQVVAVYTQPDRPAGRGRGLAASPVKREALAAGLPVLQPQSLRDRQAQDTLRALQPDLMVVVAYGLILPRAVLAIPVHGCWNVHASLLPRWRGAAPIHRAIEAGDTETGVCLMQMEKGLDTGPVLLRAATPIHADDSGGGLHDRLAELGAGTLTAGLAHLRNHNALPPAEPQDHAHATYAHKLDKAEATLDWQRAATELACKVRAFSPWPVAEATLDDERLRIHHAVAIEGRGEPGTVIAAGREGIDVACGEGALRLVTVQRDGGKALAAADYLNARPQLRR